MGMMRQSTLFTIPITFTLLTSILLGCAGPSMTPAPTPTNPEAIPSPSRRPAAAELEVVSLTVTPIVAEPGQTVTVEVKVMNVGEMEGSYSMSLTVEGVDEETKSVTVAPKGRESLAFTLVRSAPGIYGIEVAGLTDTLRVRQLGAYPRLANYYNIHDARRKIDHSQANSLARWDLIVVNFQSVYSSRESIQLIRKLNPKIKILVWISAGLQGYWWRDDQVTRQHFNESWILHYGDTPSNSKPSEERQVIIWTNKSGDVKIPGMNPTSEWPTYLLRFVNEELMSSGLFDGVFYDCLWEKMWRRNIDIDNDGIADSPDVVNREYQKGMTQLLKLTRELLGPEAIIFGNPGVQWSDDSSYWDYANGHMQENALGTMFGSSWPKIWEIYQRNMEKPSPPSRIHWIAVDTNQENYDDLEPDLPSEELQKMRFGLAITLLGDGYFGFDEGDGLHRQLWWFPEYDVDLGLAKGDAKRRDDGTWIREFENGVVIANPTSKESTFEFPNIYKDVTSGTESSQFLIAPKDGRIFLHRTS